jgi:hypothetical protein
VLAVFCAVILVAAAFYTGHSAESLDVRTYVQMIRGVADHGLPYWNNGPIDRFPELVVPHGTPAEGHVWGIYSPLYPYLVAPLFRLGGLARVSSVTFAMLAPLAVVTFLLAKTVLKDEWYATGAAVLAVISTPIMGKAVEISPFPLTVLLATLGTYLTVRLIEMPIDAAGPARRIAVFCGVSWAAASAAHVLSFPMALAAFAVIGIAPDVATGQRSLRTAITRLAPSFGAFVITTLPVSYLNHLRFASFNPISYGKPPFSGPIGMSVVDQIRYSIPATLFVTAVAVAIFVTRKRRGWWIALVVLAVAVAIIAPPLRTRFTRYGVLAFGYLVDMTFVDLEPPYEHTRDGLGQLLGGWAVKSTLQCTPLVVLAPLAFRGAGAKKWALIAILMPSVALFASFVTRANMPYVHAFGWPWVNMRYTQPALPALLVASMVVVERLKPRRPAVVSALVLGAVICTVLATSRDLMILKRVLLLLVPLGYAAAMLIVALRRNPTWVARGLIGITAGIGIGIGLGSDFRAHAEGKYWCDRWVDNFVKVVPHRFALIGQLGRFDVILTTTATHDVQYISTHRLKSVDELGPLIDYWRAEGRPIYLHWIDMPLPRLAGVSFTKVEGMPDFYLLVFAPEGQSQ